MAVVAKSKDMKVCLLTRKPALDSGGIGRVSVEIFSALFRRGYRIRTVSADNVDLVGYFKYCFLDNLVNMPKGYDIYHAVTPMESVWIPKNKGVATILDIIPITHPHLHGARMGGNRVKYTIGQACFNIGCLQAARCRYVACISDHVRQEFIEHYNIDDGKVKVIRLGIRNDLIPLPQKNDTFRLGYLGQLDRRKRVDLLIRSFKKSGIDAELVLGGKGVDEQGLKELAQDDSRIKFLGFVPDRQLADFYNSLDVLIFPTSIEGYGLPPVEAMACKKPVIVLEDAIMPQDVKERCIIVPSLEDAINSVGSLEDLCKGVDYDGNFRWAKAHSWDTAIDEYIELYRRVFDGE